MKNENLLASISYKGKFRGYQRRLLKRLEPRMNETKLNIVTPPGSGKVILGLEFARRIGRPCLILTAGGLLSNHWDQSLTRYFLPEGAVPTDYLSNDLYAPSLFTCATYEELSRAMSKLIGSENDGADEAPAVDVIQMVRDQGIGTVILDEPHHLPPRQQKALETFSGILGSCIHLLSLTATPPHDLNREEWLRYTALCGDICDEVYIPELVQGGALCPHEDLVYLNLPSTAELEGMLGFRRRVEKALDEAAALPFMKEMGQRLSRLFKKNPEFVFNHSTAISALCEYLTDHNLRSHPRMYRLLTGRDNVERLTLTASDKAINFLLESRTVLRDEERQQLLELFKEHRLVEHRRATVVSNDRLYNTISASVSKLNSIRSITEAESAHMGDALRQVVLTDALHAEELAHVSTGKEPRHVSSATVFDTLRTHCPELPIGCLSQNVLILPAAVRPTLSEVYGVAEDSVTVEPIGETDYAFFRFASNTQRNATVGHLFRDGHIRVLIGSMDMLNSGWYDRFVNTLIIAAFKSSVVETNHARGRAIHTDAACPHKTVHVWHLATVEPNYAPLKDPSLRLASRMLQHEPALSLADYLPLQRRFECFMGPTLAGDRVENGINRLGLELSNVSSENIAKMNAAMLARTDNREELYRIWATVTKNTRRPTPETHVPREASVPTFTKVNTALLAVVAIAILVSVLWSLPMLFSWFSLSLRVAPLILIPITILLVLNTAVMWLAVFFLQHILPLILFHATATHSIHSLSLSLLRTLKQLGYVSGNAVLTTELSANKKYYCVRLEGCTHHQQTIYQHALAEMLSPIGNPRYILVRGAPLHRVLWRWSFACPTVISRNEISIKVFEKYISPVMGSMKFQYTRQDTGRKFLIFARSRSYLNLFNIPCITRSCVEKSDET